MLTVISYVICSRVCSFSLKCSDFDIVVAVKAMLLIILNYKLPEINVVFLFLGACQYC